MSKIIAADATIDPFRDSLGVSRSIKLQEDGSSIISFGGNKKFKIKILSKSIVSDGDFYAEKCKIAVMPNDSSSNFISDIASAVSLDVDYFDHFMSMPEIKEKVSGIMEGNGPRNNCYSCKNVYNYKAPKYENLQDINSELSCPPVFSGVSKNEFVDGKINLFYKPGSGNNSFIYPDAINSNSDSVLSQFPFYNKFEVTTEIDPEFNNFLSKIGLLDKVTAGYIKSLQGTPTTVPFNIQSSATIAADVEVPVFDISSWIKSNEYDSIGATSSDSAMVGQYKKLLLAGYLNKLSLTNFRSFEDILHGKESHRQDFVLSVDKGLNSLVNKIQTIFLPARKNNFVFNDTQIKYGNKYIYKFTSHYVVVGNKYRYENIKFPENKDKREVHIDVINQPNVVMLPIDMFEKNLITLQPPPMKPEVKFVTKNNSSNQIQIYFTSNKGETIGSFESIFSSDESQRIALTNNYKDKILFKEYEDSALFEIYFSDKPPKSYSDFTKVSEIRMPMKTTEAYYHTDIKPNRDVYYMCRKVNERGLVSNPTPIYKIRLVVDADESKIKVENYYFPKEVTHQESRKFQSLFQVKPSFEQITFNDEQEYMITKDTLKGALDNIYLGPEENTVWGRKIKFRFKSTTSGKILDYNITFKLTKNKTEEDF